MKSNSQLFQLFALVSTVPFAFGFAAYTGNSLFSISSPRYGTISEQYLQHVAHFEWEDSYAFLAEDVVFQLPDGDTGTRTVFEGLDQVRQFWDQYEATSGNDQATFTDFVHIPITVNHLEENIGLTGEVNLCYFSGKLRYGSEVASVRMHWVFHFNEEELIDGIVAYYDRTPIIEAAKKNILQQESKALPASSEMVVQAITITSALSEEELLSTAHERAPQFRAMPGLLQKYYVRLDEPGTYGGIYIWDSKASMVAFQQSELAAGIPAAYKIQAKPEVKISDVLFQLRD